MTRYYADVSFFYSKTVNRHNQDVLLDSETLGNPPLVGVYPLWLPSIDDENRCRYIIDLAVADMTRTLYNTGITNVCYSELFSHEFADRVYDPEKVCGNHTIEFPIDHPMPESLFYESRLWYGIDEKPSLKHLYNLHVFCLAESHGCNDEQMRDAVSNFKRWNDDSIKKHAVYPSHRFQVTINRLCDCLLYELVGRWKLWMVVQVLRTHPGCLTESLAPPLSETMEAESPDNVVAEMEPVENKRRRVDEKQAKIAGNHKIDELQKSLFQNGIDLNDKSKWMPVSEYAEKIGDKIGNLKTLRNRGEKNKDGTFGRDPQGHTWAKASSQTNRIFYYIGDKSSHNVTS